VKHKARAEFREALSSTASDLLAYLERRVSTRDDAADILAETMLQAWRRMDAMPGTPERQRMSALADRLRLHLAPDVEGDHADATAVRDAVLRLHTAQRELVMLVHWDGFSIAEAADILGLNPSTARSRYSAAREVLRHSLTAVPPSG
jgi:RNA polymerase sigma-70 factor, ECF subfamily